MSLHATAPELVQLLAGAALATACFALARARRSPSDRPVQSGILPSGAWRMGAWRMGARREQAGDDGGSHHCEPSTPTDPNCTHTTFQPAYANHGATTPETDPARHTLDFPRHLTHGLERLEDVHWQLQEREARLTSLLDSQFELVVRRDLEGRLTYVNRGFCRAFGGEAGNHLGRPFDTSTGAFMSPLSVDPAAEPARTRRHSTEVETVFGRRWIAWEESLVSDRHGAWRELQSVGRDVTAERHVEAELARARDAAEAASRAKSRFLAAVSHEIRTPMNGILGMAGLLRDTSLTPEQRTYVGAVDQSARTLLGLIDEILDFSKVEAGKLELAMAPFDITVTTRDVVELLAPKAHEKGLEIAWTVSSDLPRSIQGDADRVRQIILNLVGNAIKFTQRGGILVHIGCGPPHLRTDTAPDAAHHPMIPLPDAAAAGHPTAAISVAVEDTGPGLHAETLERIFHEFEQAMGIGPGRQAGTGLGLAIARRLAHLMQGDIHVTSTPGRGSTFTLEFPAAIQAPAEPTAAMPVRADGAEPPRVLLALDRPIEARALARALAEHGAIVETCSPATVLEGSPSPLSRLAPTTIVIDRALDPALAGRILASARRLGSAIASREGGRNASREGGGNASREGGGNACRDAGDDGPFGSDPTRPVRGVVIIEPAAGSGVRPLEAAGYDTWLVRPVRPDTVVARLLETRLDRSPIEPNDEERDTDRRQRVDPASLPVTRSPRRVLLAEDNDINALLAEKLIERLGLMVERVRDGRAAVVAVEASLTDPARRFDLVLMDLHMPELDGLEATSAIRALTREGWTPPPVAALTANAFTEDRTRCLAAGMCDYIAKPFERADLDRLLRRWCP